MSRLLFLKYIYIKYLQLIKVLRFIYSSKILQILIGFISGIILSNLNIFILVILIIAGCFIFRKKFILLLIFILLGALFYLNWNYQNQFEINLSENKTVDSLAYLVDEPTQSDFKQEITIKIDGISEYAITDAPIYPQLKYGDIVNVKGTLVRNTISPEYFETIRVFYKVENSVVILMGRNSLLAFFSEIKDSFIRIVNSSIPEPEASLLNGILLGAKSNLPADLKDNLKNSGTTHIVSVSGFNVTIIYILLLSFSKIVNRKLLRVISILLIISFLLIVGLYNLSAVRATLMLLFIIIGEATGRKHNIWIALLLSLGLILIDYPLYFKNISLELSIFALMGLFLFTKDFQKIFDKTHLPDLVKEIISSSLAVTITTLPIIFLTFQSTSLVSIISNLLILPLLPFLTLLGFGCIAMGIMNISILAKPLFFLEYCLLKYIISVINFIGSQTWAVTNNSSIALVLLISLIMMLIIHDFINFKKITLKYANKK